MTNAFHWLDDGTTKISATTSSANGALKRMPTGVTQLRVYNAGTTLAFIRKGTDSTVFAAATDLPIAPGELEVLTLQNNPASPITHIAAIFATGSGDVYVTVGSGI